MPSSATVMPIEPSRLLCARDLHLARLGVLALVGQQLPHGAEDDLADFFVETGVALVQSNLAADVARATGTRRRARPTGRRRSVRVAVSIGELAKDRREFARERVELLHGRQREPDQPLEIVGFGQGLYREAIGELGGFQL